MPTLSASHDPLGHAIADYHHTGRSAHLRVHSSMFDTDEIPVALLFRTAAQMPQDELIALGEARGHTLDVGAGSGCHSLELQQRGLQTTAIDISPLAVTTMQERGVNDARLVDFFSPQLQGQFHTILMLMNGLGIVGRLHNMPQFFARLEELLAPGGQALVTSSDLRYIFEDEEGEMDWDPTQDYYGQVDYWMQCGTVKGPAFDWLFLDPTSLQRLAQKHGFRAEIIYNGPHYDYLARIVRDISK